MHRDPIQSSTVRSIGHDPEALTLEIEFTNGTVYQYFDVPVAVYAEFMQATSPGQFFGTQIKGQFRYARL
jgi:hypothetical protein